jgi:hypothetical protein
MLRRINLVVSGLIFAWYLTAATLGWKGWVLGFDGGSSGGRTSGGHGTPYFGGWGGGK